MASYTVIADVGAALVRLLQSNMVPNVVMNAESIGLCSPDDKGDIMLGLYLYDIRESEEYRNSTMVNIDARSQRYPSLYLTLYYMVTAYSNGDIKFRSLEEQKMLGKAMQVLGDSSMLDARSLEPAQNAVDALRIELLPLNIDEKMKIWNVPNKPYKASLFYKVTPVELESEKKKNIQRVVDMEFEFKE